MAPAHKHFYSLAFYGLPSMKTQLNPANPPPSPTSDHAFPILAIAVLSIMGTAVLLVGYYVFVIKCSSIRHQLNLLRWISMWRARRDEDPFIALSPSMWNRGLDDSVIREIPTFQFKRGEGEERSIHGCVVCLNEFQEQDMLRVLPNCGHAFHLDCIDIWLQSSPNCPLCRSSISGTTRYPFDHIIAPSSSPQGSQPYTDSIMGRDDDFVVIELGGGDESFVLPHTQQQRNSSRQVLVQTTPQPPLNMEQKFGMSKPRKRQHVSIMGDECIDVRGKDDQFSIQTIRRSFSLDSAIDRQLYLTVQEIIQQNRHRSEINTNEESSNRVRRTLFSFGHGRVSRNAVLPIEFEPTI